MLKHSKHQNSPNWFYFPPLQTAGKSYWLQNWHRHRSESVWAGAGRTWEGSGSCTTGLWRHLCPVLSAEPLLMATNSEERAEWGCYLWETFWNTDAKPTSSCPCTVLRDTCRHFKHLNKGNKATDLTCKPTLQWVSSQEAEFTGLLQFQHQCLHRGTRWMEGPALGPRDETGPPEPPAVPRGFVPSQTPQNYRCSQESTERCGQSKFCTRHVRFSWCQLLQTGLLAQPLLVSVSFLKLLQEQQRKEIKVVSQASLQSYNLRSAADRLLQIFNIWIHLPVTKTTPQAS